MFVRVDEPFTDEDGTDYLIETVSQERGKTIYVTFLLEKDSTFELAATGEDRVSNASDFEVFARHGWSREEYENHFKDTWTIQLDKKEYVDYLNRYLPYGADSWLCLEAWDYLPKEEYFFDWLDDYFLPEWDRELTPEEEKEKEEGGFVDDNDEALNKALDRIDEDAKKDPSIIQPVHLESMRIENAR